MRVLNVATAAASALLAVVGVAKAGPNLLTNGDFAVPITAAETDYTIPADCSTTMATSCQVPEQTVFVNTNPMLDHPSWASFTAAGSGNDNANMLVVNGGENLGAAVWKQSSISVSAYQTYVFTGSAAANYTLNDGLLQLAFNGVTTGSAFDINSTVPGTWQSFSFTWYSGAATVLNLGLFDLDSQPNGNDFSVTNFSLGIVSVSEPASVAALVIGMSAVTILRLRRRRH